MSRGLPISLWKYVLVELWRLILLSTFVLVTVIAFVAAIKPLADGKLAPLETLKFMGLAIVPMLQWALPFAAGFGATLCYHRLSHDNELTAAYAGGVSHRSVLWPAALTGLVLSCVLLLLCQQVIPRFLRSMERLIALDATKMLLSSIQRGQPVQLPGSNRVLYADRIARLTPSPESGARDELALWGVAALDFDSEGRVIGEATAATARIWVFSGDSVQPTVVSVRLRDTLAKQKTGLVRAPEMTFSISAAGGMRDNPKFLPYGELEALHEFPENQRHIESRRRDLAVHLAEKASVEGLSQALATARKVTLMSGDDPMVVYASGLVQGENGRIEFTPLTPGGPVEVDVVRPAPSPDQPPQVNRIVAKTAGLVADLGPDRNERRLTFRLELENATTLTRTGPGGAPEALPGGERTKLLYPGLTPPPQLIAHLLDPAQAPTTALLAMDQTVAAAPGSGVAQAAAALRHEIAGLHREVTSKQHERFAIAAACLVMVISGAVMAIKLSSMMPLTVYLWSFFPALATIITINSGQHMAQNKGVAGLIVLWGGVAVLGVYSFIGYWKLARH